jgi:short-subunit dehydrogenase
MAKDKPAVWITGASSGIGRASAVEFAKIGGRVFVSARRVTELERLNRELKKDDMSVDIFPCNVASSANVDQTVKRILAESDVDCLINNAGVTSWKLAEENSTNEIDDVINTNLLGSIYTIKYLLPHFIERGGGTIINILSIVTKKIFTHSSAYAASKMGLLGYTDVLREEVRKHKIRVINVIPGTTETPMWPTKVREENSERMLNPEEIARVIVSAYLERSNMVTEEILVRPMEGDL